MLGILRRQESALVMVEPPCQAGVGGVFEVHDGVLIPVEHGRLKQLRGLVRQTGKIELGIGMEFLLDKAAEEGRRRRAVETMVVI